MIDEEDTAAEEATTIEIVDTTTEIVVMTTEIEDTAIVAMKTEIAAMMTEIAVTTTEVEVMTTETAVMTTEIEDTTIGATIDLGMETVDMIDPGTTVHEKMSPPEKGLNFDFNRGKNRWRTTVILAPGE